MADARSDNHAEARKGWSWFDRDEPAQNDDALEHPQPDVDRELRIAYARCFATQDGEKVLNHLRALTLDRAFGPDASDQTLRHMEGQRQLVTYILAQLKRGQHGS